MNELQVIGAGLGRTGTLSLKMALEQLGFGPCDHMVELINRPERLRHWKALHHTGTTDFAALFAGYRSIVDYPGALFYRTLLAANPGAKVILTVRDLDSWYRSALATIHGTKPQGFGAKLNAAFTLLSNRGFRRAFPVFRFADEAIWQGQFGGRFTDRDHAIAVHQAHIREVKATVPAAQLLVYDVTAGWQPLCDFLGVAVPDQPFPSSNSRREFGERVSQLMTEGRMSLPGRG
ncbi:MAG: sulfotransferase family protein [Porticoccaceae bacterium]|jgi:hypothetical protein|nr:sulfotransferase [Porticoccaceae bacterium]MEA3300761.1 sulfotransferase [Pseudomonadota bacterium]HLS98623.1 sulfotransferase [Porticoccaceae bacterium]